MDNKQQKRKQLESLLPGLQKDVLLKGYTTFKIGGPAKCFYVAKTKKGLIKALGMAKKLICHFLFWEEEANC